MQKRINRHFRSYGFAINGIFKTLKRQSNIWIHLTAAFVVIVAGWHFRLTRIEWVLVIFAIGLVISAELLNTALEVTLNYLAKEHHLDVEAAKDIAAGAVLISSIAAAMIGGLIFLPHLFP